ncbi:putative telomerase reverse transcriptase [Blattamonas nauphoetae]|uniref:Telomerase reverse transcriptase n=1 Tax=Blattamonas nauphoetae TaxID=2049346 RepID=A0ABQ9XH51_9EUKA|nr:putative telomerase reverse transcriptase [Blattamonas nauphoetae]
MWIRIVSKKHQHQPIDSSQSHFLLRSLTQQTLRIPKPLLPASKSRSIHDLVPVTKEKNRPIEKLFSSFNNHVSGRLSRLDGRLRLHDSVSIREILYSKLAQEESIFHGLPAILPFYGILRSDATITCPYVLFYKQSIRKHPTPLNQSPKGKLSPIGVTEVHHFLSLCLDRIIPTSLMGNSVNKKILINNVLLICPLVRFFFFATERGHDGNRIFFYDLAEWTCELERLEAERLSAEKESSSAQLDTKLKLGESEKYNLLDHRMLPKNDGGFRFILRHRRLPTLVMPDTVIHKPTQQPTREQALPTKISSHPLKHRSGSNTNNEVVVSIEKPSGLLQQTVSHSTQLKIQPTLAPPPYSRFFQLKRTLSGSLPEFGRKDSLSICSDSDTENALSSDEVKSTRLSQEKKTSHQSDPFITRTDRVDAAQRRVIHQSRKDLRRQNELPSPRKVLACLGSQESAHLTNTRERAKARQRLIDKGINSESNLISQKTRDAQAALNCLRFVPRSPYHSSVFCVAEAFPKLLPFYQGHPHSTRFHKRSAVLVADVKKAFDMFDQHRLVQTVKNVLPQQQNSFNLYRMTLFVQRSSTCLPLSGVSSSFRLSSLSREVIVFLLPSKQRHELTALFGMTRSHCPAPSLSDVLHCRTVLSERMQIRYNTAEKITSTISWNVHRTCVDWHSTDPVSAGSTIVQPGTAKQHPSGKLKRSTSSLLRTTGRFSLIRRGIAQGSILSPFLCNLFLAQHEQYELPQHILTPFEPSEDTASPHTTMIRMMDDYIFVSRSKTDMASAVLPFVEAHLEGSSSTDWMELKKDKLQTSIAIDGIQKQRRVKWCGFVIDSHTLEWKKAPDSAIAKRVRATYSNPHSKPCQSYLLSLPIHLNNLLNPLLFSPCINTNATIKSNIIICGRVLRAKLHKCVSSLPFLSTTVLRRLKKETAKRAAATVLQRVQAHSEGRDLDRTLFSPNVLESLFQSQLKCIKPLQRQKQKMTNQTNKFLTTQKAEHPE